MERCLKMIALTLSCVMCFVVGYNYCNMKWTVKYLGFSAPAETAFLYAIPYLLCIFLCFALSHYYSKRNERKTNN